MGPELLLEAKMKGFADRQIAHLLGTLESKVFELRQKFDIQRVYKLVDTCAAEFKAETPIIIPLLKEKSSIPMELLLLKMKVVRVTTRKLSF